MSFGCVCWQVVQEYERAVIFRLGRLMQGGAKGPGTAQLSITNTMKIKIETFMCFLPLIFFNDKINEPITSIQSHICVTFRSFHMHNTIVQTFFLAAQTCINQNILHNKTVYEWIKNEWNELCKYLDAWQKLWNWNELKRN